MILNRLARNVPAKLRRRSLAAAAAVGLAVTLASPPVTSAQDTASTYRVEPAGDGSGWTVYEAEDRVAGYVLESNGKPIIYPLYGPGGHALTRDYPMKEAGPHERDDHDHHRSMWLTHGEVNGIDFWLDDPERGCGTIRHRRGSASTNPSGHAVIATENDWLAPDGARVLSDVRRFEFHNDGGRRIIDCDFRLIASDGDVHFGDTKEGTFGIRVAGTMKVDADPGGQITNATGETNKAAWGERSPWVDYSGPVDGDTAGITVHSHPSSHNDPCRWHVRTYGLFAANPFGVYHFEGGDKTDGFTLHDGESISLHYRVVLHEGGLNREQTEADSKAYRETERPKDF